MKIQLFAVAAVAGGALIAGSVASSNAESLPAASTPVASTSFVATNSNLLQQKVAWRFVVEGENNKARYRVRERLAGRDLDNDAVGETPRVTGVIAVDDKGKVVAAESHFTAELTPLKSDSDRRDGYVRRNILVTDSFPSTTLRITEVRGLPSPIPTSGTAAFQLVGDLTIKGVTKSTVWNVNATLNGNTLTGNASTRFTFAEFSLRQPRVPIVLSVADSIGLEYDFVMVRK